MPASKLKLFRRHEASCTQAYAKDDRVYQWMLEKQKGKKTTADCSCTIYTEGTLYRADGSKNYLRPKSTDQRTWSEAEAVKANWLKWGGTVPPVEVASTTAPEEPGTLVTIQAATKAFLVVKENQRKAGKLSVNRYKNFVRDMEVRLVPFATITNRLQYIQEMDNETIWAELIKSWQNLTEPEKQLGPGTISLATSNLRGFLKFCVRKKWLSDNYASKDYDIVAYSVIKPKEPFSNLELSYIYQAAKEVRRGIGKNYHTGQQRAVELLISIQVLRYTGLRISDVVPMRTYQLQPFQSGNYTHALLCNPQKTKGSRQNNFVHIPIPSGNPNHPNLTAALLELAKNPKQGSYFFRNGEGTEETQIGAWRRRIMTAFERAEELMEADGLPKKNGTHFGVNLQVAEHPTPHKFRHTFAATLLQGGASIRLVAQYLGDTEQTVRKHYAKFCVAEQKQAAIQLGNAMDEFDAQTAETQRARLQVVK